MPAIVATFAAPSPTALTMAAAASAILVTGEFGGGTILIEISDNGTNWGRALAVSGEPGSVASTPGASGFTCPTGWQVRVTLQNARLGASVRVAVE